MVANLVTMDKIKTNLALIATDMQDSTLKVTVWFAGTYFVINKTGETQ